MQITLIENEIKAAIKLYLEKNIGLSHEMNIAVDFTATRGSEGLKASIDVNSKDTPEVPKSKPEIIIDKSTGEVLQTEPEKKTEEAVTEPLAQVEATYTSKPAKSLFANLTV